MLIFDFNSSERRGLLVLAVILVLGIGFKYTLPYIIPETKTDFSKFKKEISELEFAKEQELKEKEDRQKSYKQNNYSKYNKTKYKKKKVKYFKLNPNTAKTSDWKKFGFSEKQSYIIYNYIKACGGINNKSQLKKIFVIDDKKYKEMSPYIVITKEDAEKKDNNSYKSYSNDNIQVVELNTANKKELMSISGIGPFLSDMIIEYRSSLGGFYSKEQLKEVYGIKPETFEKIKGYIIIDKTSIQKLNVNFSDTKMLSSHPYINYKLAKAIVDYRTKNGFIKDVTILFDKKIITDKKLKYYLITQD